MFFDFIHSKGKTMIAQQTVDALQNRLKDFDERIGRARTDIEAKRKAAGRAILEGRDSSPIEEDFTRVENHILSLLAAKKEAERGLAEATAEFIAEKQRNAEARVRTIRQEIDGSMSEMEEHLTRAKESAQEVDELLKEARQIKATVNVSLSPLGAWVNILPAFHGRSLIGEGIESLQEKIRQHKPKQ